MIAKRTLFFFIFLVFVSFVAAEVVEQEINADGTQEAAVPQASAETIENAIPETAEQPANIPVPGDEEPVVVEETREEQKTEDVDPKCPDRGHIIRCAGEYLDTNKNGALDREELESAISALPWYARGILQILGSVDKMMQKCDADKDGKISMDYDMENNKETCLATCFKRRAFKGAFFPECEA